MRYYRLKPGWEGQYVPRMNCQTVDSEKWLASGEWMSADDIYRKINGPGQPAIRLSRVEDHLRYWLKYGRLEVTERL